MCLCDVYVCCMFLFLYFFFFFKQKTAYEMRISDWSSDVCSSDLLACNQVIEQAAEEDRHHQFERQVDADRGAEDRHAETRTAALQPFVERDHQRADHRAELDPRPRQVTAEPALGDRRHQLGPRPDRKGAGSGKTVSGRVGLGGRRIIKTKKMQP